VCYVSVDENENENENETKQNPLTDRYNYTLKPASTTTVNIYGFERLTIGTDIGSYTHNLLVRGKPNICRFMIRTKVKNKGSKSAASGATTITTQRLSHNISTSRNGISRRSSSSSAITSTEPLTLPMMIRSISWPGAATASKHARDFSRRSTEAIVSNASTTGLHNDIFRPEDKVQSLRICNNNKVDHLPAIEDDFADELFSNEIFPDVDLTYGAIDNSGTKHTANITIDGISDINNRNCNYDINNNIGIDRISVFPSMLLCDNSHDDITVLGNSNHSNKTQASDIVIQPSPLDPFLRVQQKQRQEQMQQQQQQRRQQECQLLQLQIMQLQNRIMHLNQGQHPQIRQIVPNTIHISTTINNNNNNNNNSRYLCNGVAAIEPSDRSTITRTISPRETSLHSNISNNNNPNNPLHQLERDELLLNPTPIFAPFVPMYNDSQNNNNMCGGGIDADSDMRRSISFCSFPQLVSGNVK
jgi:hypothetical protein